VSGVLALALRLQALSRGTVPSTVPVGHPLDRGDDRDTWDKWDNWDARDTFGRLSRRRSLGLHRNRRAGALAADSVPAGYLDAWAQLQCDPPLLVSRASSHGALQRVGRRLAGVLQQQPPAFVALQLPPLRRGSAGLRPAAAVRNRDYRPCLAAFSLLVAWSAARQAEAVAALEAIGIATPAGFPNDFDKNGGP
jgi:hypothetical protein